MGHRRTIAVDFDGVLHQYSKGWQQGDIYDPPVPGATEAILDLVKDFNIVVFTVRKDLQAVQAWIKTHLGLVLDVTNEKPIASIYIDDRGYRFNGDWIETVKDIRTIQNRTWQGV